MGYEYRVQCSGLGEFHRPHVYRKPDALKALAAAEQFNADHTIRMPEQLAYRDCYPLVAQQREVSRWEPVSEGKVNAGSERPLELFEELGRSVAADTPGQT